MGNKIINAADVTSIWQSARECIEILGVKDPVVDLRILSADAPLVDVNGSGEGRVSVEFCKSGIVTASLLLPDGEAIRHNFHGCAKIRFWQRSS